MIAPQEAPHVIILDLHMPNMNGLEVLHWLRHSHSDQDVAVYLLTSSEEPEDRRQAAKEHATGYILKSPLFGKLIQQLDHVIATGNERWAKEAGEHDGADRASSELRLAHPFQVRSRA
jgi:DNA-binding NarL/FixJ family response regulator